MVHHPDSSSGKLWQSSGETSPDQSDTGDVLIHSTRVLLPERRHEAGPGSVKITVRKLRDLPSRLPVAEQQKQSYGTKKQQKANDAPPLRTVVTRQPDRRTLTKPELTKENSSAAAESSPNRKLSAGPHDQQQPGHDLLTSRFEAGVRGVVLTALKQRSHSAPCRREVRVQLLDPLPPSGRRSSSQDAVGVAAGVQTEAELFPGCSRVDTNAAALIKVEAQVSQLTDGVNKLLQTDRDRGWSLSQQSLHHLEVLHSQQLQLQSQLLESALRIVTSHTPVTSTTSDPAVTPDLTSTGEPAHLQLTGLDAAANVHSPWQPSSAATAASETSPVAMETPRRDQWPQQTSVSTATQPAAGSHLQSSANHSQAAARRTNDMLREMGRLKTEMKMLLMPEGSQKAMRTGPEHRQFQQNLVQQSCPQQLQLQQNLFKSSHFQSKYQQSKSQQTQPEQNQSHSQQTHSQSHQNSLQKNFIQQNHFQSKSQQNQSQSQQPHSQSHQMLVQQSQSQKDQTSRIQSQQFQSRPVVPSMLEEAGQVLRQVQRQKKVLEENLEALQRGKTGEVLHCQLEALAAKRDWTDKVRVKKTVDAWIHTVTKDVQAEMSSKDTATKHSARRDAMMTSQQKVSGRPTHSGKGRPVSVLRGTASKTAAERGSRERTAGHSLLQRAEPDGTTSRTTDSQQVEVDGESYLSRLYGRAPYEGLRRTLKKSPYLRFCSPGSPLSRKPRPRLVESVRGVKVKSCKTQTCLAPPLSLTPAPPQHYCIISPSRLTSGDPTGLTATSADSYSVPIAIPLGHPRADPRCLAERQQEVTCPPTARPTSSVVAVDYKRQSQEADQLNAGEAPPPPPPHPHVDVIERKSEEEEDEENIFPGTDFLSVADVVQEELSVVGEEVVELDGGPSPPLVLYQGPVFPPQAPSVLPAQDHTSFEGLNQRRDALESRLVEWVEQQLMARMISEMYRTPPSDPAQTHSTDQSEDQEQSVSSDIGVEAAGGGGLQLFVDSNVAVDSALIRQLVDEVLTEHIVLMLGHRDALETGPEPGMKPPEPGLEADQEEKLVPLVPTLAPIPSPSPTPPSRQTPPLATPSPFEPTSLLNKESPQPITAPEPVATPTSSPEPTHPPGSPPVLCHAPPPLPWGDAELPLDEERPEEHLDTHSQALLMSVAEEEPPLSSPPPPPSIPPVSSLSPPPPHSPDPRPASPCSSSEDPSTSNTSSSSGSSSSVVTAGTDAALKHISEGELLISVNQLTAMTEEEAVCSFSSSLQELQEMDFDPPSEGQVRGHDLLLTLLTKMKQGVTHTHGGERPQPDGSWWRDQEEEDEVVSVGEVIDDRTPKPHQTSNLKNCRKSAAHQGQPSSSPGQISQSAEVSEVIFEATSQGSVTMDDLMMEPVGALTSDLQADLLSPPSLLVDTHAVEQVAPVLVRAYEPQTAGNRRMEVHLPSVRLEEEMMEEKAADTDSSTIDVF
uniref:protein TALPID3 isoform X2 n=1 Tax=Scatophagus argus TaxID=75038 RepID=UPI001ED820CD|nr:protein TALPID3 isoform X2 [Scatophagus argus]